MPRVKGLAIAKMLPQSIKIDLGGGKGEIVIAGNKQENDLQNKIMVGILRHFIDKAVEKYENMDETPSPKELQELVRAGAELIKASGEVYKAEEPDSPQGPKVATPAPDIPIDVSFDNLTKRKDEPTP